MYDVIIAGAGAAGATAAYFLAEGGCRVLVLEKQKLPRYKACGGGISLAYIKSQFPFSFDPVIDRHVNVVHYHYFGHKISMPVPEDDFIMVMRERFDAHILSQARCDVRDGCSVRQVTQSQNQICVEISTGEQVCARYLIGADGANSVIARAAGFRLTRKLMPAVEAEITPPDKIMQQFSSGPVFIFNRRAFNYSWIFPKAGCLSVGTGLLHPHGEDLRQTLHALMQPYGINLDGVRIHGHPIPLYRPGGQVASPRILLAGDAAGLVDPFSGEGVRLAIKSGRLAAEAILSGQPNGYSQSVDQQIGRWHRQSLFTARVFYRLPRLCLRLGAPNPRTTRAILGLLSDRGSALDVMLTAITTLPAYLLSRIFNRQVL